MVEVDGRTVLATEIDPEADPDMYVPAPRINEGITFSVQTMDDDYDTLTILWAVKDGPEQDDTDVGTLYWESDSAFATWAHDEVGTYWVSIIIQDGMGGVALFQFNVYVHGE